VIPGLIALALATVPSGQSAPQAPGPGWQLAWSDEFDGPRIDPEKWTLAQDCWGGGNKERQCYTDSAANARVEDGVLQITARRERFTGPAITVDQGSAADRKEQVTRPFTSARLSTRGKAAWRYGLIEVRARLPQGQGLWPAIWMLPQESRFGAWAASGEIDIMEAVNLGEPCPAGRPGCPAGQELGVLGTLHFGGTPPANVHRGLTTAMPTPLDGFHVYALEWSPEAITWRIDGKAYQTQRPGDWSTSGSPDPAAPFDRQFYLILNVAVGGHLAEDNNRGGVSTKGFPKAMAVDWVRVWQCRGDPASTAPCATNRG
jgi:beta-glucanase (GH16 family)